MNRFGERGGRTPALVHSLRAPALAVDRWLRHSTVVLVARDVLAPVTAFIGWVAAGAWLYGAFHASETLTQEGSQLAFLALAVSIAPGLVRMSTRAGAYIRSRPEQLRSHLAAVHTEALLNLERSRIAAEAGSGLPMSADALHGLLAIKDPRPISTGRPCSSRRVFPSTI